MPDFSRWIDSVLRYVQERGVEHLAPALCMLMVQLCLIVGFMFAYVPFAVGVLMAEDYPWAPFAGAGVGAVIFFAALAVIQPVHVGYVHGTLRSMRGEGFPLSELFWGFRRLPSVLAIFVASMSAVFLGTLFCYLPGLLAGILLGLAGPALADRDAGAIDALTTSFTLVKANFWAATLWWLLTLCLLMVASFIPVVGPMLSIPLASILQATAYLFLTRGR